MSSIGWRGSNLNGRVKMHESSARRSCDVVIRPARPEGKKTGIQFVPHQSLHGFVQIRNNLWSQKFVPLQSLE